MPTTVEPRIRTIAGVTAAGDTKFVTNGNATDYINVRLTDGTAFYTATGSGGSGGATTTINLGSYGGTATTLGQKAMAASIPVVFASDQSSITASINNQSVFVLNSAAPQASVNIATDSVGLAKEVTVQAIHGVLSDTTSTLGAAVPPKAIYIGFRDNSGNLQFGRTFGNATSINTSNNNHIAMLSQTFVKNGSVWEAVTGIGSNGMTVTGSNISIASMPTTNVSQSGSWFVTANVSNTINANVTAAQSIPSNFQNTTNVNSWGGTATTLGQKAMASSVPVVLPNNQTVAVSVSNFSDNAFSNTSNIGSYGGVSTTLGQKSMAASIPVAIASDQVLPLPTGAATAALQTQQDNRLITIDANIANIEDLVAIPNQSFNRFMAIGGERDDTGTVAVGEGQINTVRLTAQRAMHANMRDSDGNQLLGQKSMALSIPVAIASDQTAFAVNASQNGSWYITANNYSTSVDTIVQTYSDNTSSATSSAYVCSGHRWATFSFQASMANAPTLLQLKASGTIDGTNYDQLQNGFLGNWIYDDVILGTGYSASVMFPINHHAIKMGVSTSGNNNSKTFTITRASLRFSY